jgi:benzoylformate decarboxylase
MADSAPLETIAKRARRAAVPTVRDDAFEVLCRHGLTTIFSNPGSTEIPLLTNLPDDFEFVLGLHEASVVGMATGWAIAGRRPTLVILHTTAGLGNAVGALATARVNRAPLVVLVGQQDRRHFALEPFLAGDHLDRLAGEYPVWVDQPLRAQDVPGSLLRARHEAEARQGPAVVIVPMDDWDAPAERSSPNAAPEHVHRPRQLSQSAIRDLVVLVEGASAPAIVVGAGGDDPTTWRALTSLAESLCAPVWQEAFGARAGFPQDHPLFAGHLPAARSGLREALAAYDVVLSVGAPVFRQYVYEPGPLVGDATRIAVVTEHSDEAHRSAAEIAVIGSLTDVCEALLEHVTPRQADPPPPLQRPDPPPPPSGRSRLHAGHVLSALAERLPADVILVEECPSNRFELHARIPARQPLGFVSAAMGGLGFAMPAAVGIRMVAPDRPVVAVVGDGSSLYANQALWSAARYRAGVLFVVLSNGGYAIMDELAARHGGAGPWPGFQIDISALAQSLGCEAMTIERYPGLIKTLDLVLPTLGARETPLLLDVRIARDGALR